MSAFMFGNEGRTVACSCSRARDEIAVTPTRTQGNPVKDVLLAAWEEIVARKGDAPAIFATSGEVSRTFREIEEKAGFFEIEISAAAGQVYPIDLGNHPDWPSVLLACLRLRRIALPLEKSITPEQRTAALQMCESEVTQERPALLKLTSGTTAAPRAIRFRSEQLLADCGQICQTMGLTDDDVNFAVIPLSHSYGFSNLVTPLLVFGIPLVLSRDRMPRAVLTISRAPGRA